MTAQDAVFQSLSLERGLIGQALLDPDVMTLPEVRRLERAHFRHLGGVWEQLRDLYDREGALDLPLLATRVGTHGWPQNVTVTDLVDFDAYALPIASVPAAARALMRVSTRERLQALLARTHQLAGDAEHDPATLISETERALQQLRGEALPETSSHIGQGIETAIERILNPRAHFGVTTGLPSLDAQLNGWQRGTLNIVAGRPSMGKSALLSQFAQMAALGGPSAAARTLFFTLEDGKVTTQERALKRLGGVDLPRERASGLQLIGDAQRKLQAAGQRLATLPWHLDESRALDDIIALCWARANRDGLDFVVIDQLSHITATPPGRTAENRNQLFGHIAKELKHQVAKRLGVPVILASQLSREVTRRGDNRPKLEDLRDSGELEQDADTVIFVHRPEYYDKADRPGEAELIVAKQRNGPTGSVWTNCNLKLFSFWEDRA